MILPATIDMELLSRLRRNWLNIQDAVILELDRDYRIFEGRTFKLHRFEDWLIRSGIPWPRLESGQLDLGKDTLRGQAKAYPIVAPIHELRSTLADLRLESLAVGRDGRNRTLLSEPSGAVTSYAYYPDGALKSVGYGGSGTAADGVSYTYYPDGSRQTMTDGTGTTAYAYDKAGRLLQVTDGNGQSVKYGYVDGQLTTTTYPGGQLVTESYNGAGQVTAVKDWLGHQVSFGYDADGNLTTETLPGGVTQVREITAALTALGGSQRIK